jgi:hypothetical protein
MTGRRKRKNVVVVVCGQRRRRRRRAKFERVEAEIKNFVKAGAISGKDNRVELEAKNKGNAVAIGRGKGNSVTNDD